MSATNARVVIEDLSNKTWEMIRTQFLYILGPDTEFDQDCDCIRATDCSHSHLTKEALEPLAEEIMEAESLPQLTLRARCSCCGEQELTFFRKSE